MNDKDAYEGLIRLLLVRLGGKVVITDAEYERHKGLKLETESVGLDGLEIRLRSERPS